tara:strand:+ start:3754 stop:4125 length:372 start_codon:yes stop_codon:yes gene_type:complete
MLRKDIEEKYPFISLIQYGGKEYVGIVVNQDQFITTILDYSNLKNISHKKYFLELGELWWMESNRMIPITIFLRNDIEHLRYCLRNLNSKDVKVLLGPVVNLGSMHLKRIKRKSIQMVRRPKK